MPARRGRRSTSSRPGSTPRRLPCLRTRRQSTTRRRNRWTTNWRSCGARIRRRLRITPWAQRSSKSPPDRPRCPRRSPSRMPQIIADTDHIVDAMGIRPVDTQVAVIPLSHAYGFGNLIMPMLLNGTAMVLRESFVPQHLAVRRAAVRRARLPRCAVHVSVLRGESIGGRLARLSAGADLGGCPPRVRDRRRLPPRLYGVKIHSFYGTSEAGGICFDRSDRDRREADRRLAAARRHRHAAAGRRHSRRLRQDPHPKRARSHGATSARPVRATPLPTAASSPATTARSCRTDVLALAGRISAFINVAGRKVHPGEVERVLQSIDGIADARVIVAADAIRGEQIAAVLAGGRGLIAGRRTPILREPARAAQDSPHCRVRRRHAVERPRQDRSSGARGSGGGAPLGGRERCAMIRAQFPGFLFENHHQRRSSRSVL